MNWKTLLHNLGNVAVAALGSIAAFDWTSILTPETAGLSAVIIAVVKFGADLVSKGFAGAFGAAE